MKTLADSISKYSKINHTILEEITNQFHPFSLEKKEYLIKAGEVAKSLVYIKAGYIRMFHSDIDGNETTVWIGSNDKFITAISSFVFQRPSFWNIEAITDCELLIIKRESHFHLCKKYREWLDFENFLLSQALASLEYRMFVQMNLSAQERYLEFFKKGPGIFNQVPSKHLASYLGMSPETLSRLRKNEHSYLD